MSLRSISPALACLSLLVGCAAGSSDPVGGGEAEDTPPSPDTPEELYGKHCGACHGPTGEGTEYGPQVQNPVAGYAHYVTRTGRDEMGFASGMKGFPVENLPDADVYAIIDFLREAEKPIDGQGLYLRFCGNCHGAQAEGGRVGEPLLGEAEEGEFAETVREGAGGDDYGDRESYMPGYPAIELTDQEVELIRQYVESLGPGEEEEDEEEDDEDEEEEEEEEEEDDD